MSHVASKKSTASALGAISSINALNRLSFGADPGSLEQLSSQGLEGWLEEQFNPISALDGACEQQIANFTMPIKYGEHKEGLWPAVDEIRSFQWLNASAEDLMNITLPGKPVSGEEQWRPAREVMCATLIRSVYSRWQVHEMLTGFWHNHFNVNAWEGLPRLLLPVYDREVIRPNALGNFRQLLEVVAKSGSMQSYLNNRSSRAGAPNENYARELFELHTMGTPAYLNTLYNQWRKVPGAFAGKPIGYIDQDVYEAARAFTGWSVADGASIGNGKNLPRTGEFIYVDAWHDQYQKRILAKEIDPYQGPMHDGSLALDLTAFHPATAAYLSNKLCLLLVGESPPKTLIESTTAIWVKFQEHPRQIAKVVKHIALSPEFAQAKNTKVKKPMELMASYVRALKPQNAYPFMPTIGLINHLNTCGQALFGWPTPAGLPDNNARWLGANALWQRWNLIAGLTDNWWQCGNIDVAVLGKGTKPTTEQWAQFCTNQLLGSQNISKNSPNDSFMEPISAQLIEASGQKAESALSNPAIAKRMLAWTAMTPPFQVR